MKFTLFFALFLLCIIELNAVNLRSQKKIVKNSERKTNSTILKKTKDKEATKEKKGTKEKKERKNKEESEDKKKRKEADKKKEKEKNEQNDKKNRMKEKIMKKSPSNPKNINQDNTKKVIKFLKSKLGCGYAYGSNGQILTEDLLNYFKGEYKDNVKDSTKQWLNKQCYDCSGLVMEALKEAGINVHHSAHYTWTEDMKERGDIKDIPKDKVCLVFRKGSNGEMEHIGIYLGNGKVIEAKGADSGVIKTKLKEGSWTNWGIPAGLE